MVGFSGILGTGWVEDRKMMKDKLIDDKRKVKEWIQKKKKTRLKSTKEKDISNWFSTKQKHYKK